VCGLEAAVALIEQGGNSMTLYDLLTLREGCVVEEALPTVAARTLDY
jgi:hypothetical protein